MVRKSLPTVTTPLRNALTGRRAGGLKLPPDTNGETHLLPETCHPQTRPSKQHHKRQKRPLDGRLNAKRAEAEFAQGRPTAVFPAQEKWPQAHRDRSRRTHTDAVLDRRIGKCPRTKGVITAEPSDRPKCDPKKEKAPHTTNHQQNTSPKAPKLKASTKTPKNNNKRDLHVGEGRSWEKITGRSSIM